jgi:DNA polymerase-3 subunit epsilon
MYAILDIETTGGSPKSEKITEIALYIHDGEKIINEFTTLINPEKPIPYFISSLTGITDEMVEDAPKFYEIARQLVELTEDMIIVAHNVSFDYRFIRSEFKSLGFDFSRNNLCTLQLSRRLFPGHRSYSLGNICKDLGIEIENRHRAAGDALATVKLLEKLLSMSRENGNETLVEVSSRPTLKNLHPLLDRMAIDKLPEETGVYYFMNDQNQVIYVGKSRNLKQRVYSHLTNNGSRRSMELKENIASVEYELTGSELVALLVESSEIKRHSPFYNRAQKRKMMQYGLYSFKDDRGYINLKIDRTALRLSEIPYTCYLNQADAKESLSRLAERYWLCQKLCGLYETEGACFHYGIRQCNGACIGKESSAIYNNRVTRALSTFYYENQNFLIIDKGRNQSERSIVQVENGKYVGFGYLDTEESYVHLDSLLGCVKVYEDNRDIHQIIRAYLNKNDVEKIIKY